MSEFTFVMTSIILTKRSFSFEKNTQVKVKIKNREINMRINISIRVVSCSNGVSYLKNIVVMYMLILSYLNCQNDS